MPRYRTVPRALVIFASTIVANLGAAHPSLAQAPAIDCLAVEELRDADVAAHAADLSDPSLCLTEREIEEDGHPWRLTLIANRDQPGPLWAVPHDEEDEAFAGGVYAVRRYGGVMVAIENDGERLVDGLDPNHIFAVTDSAAAICPGTTAPAPAYVEAFLAHWDTAYPVVGLHSNWDGHSGDGGLGTISVLLEDDKMIPFPSETAEGRLADEDTVAMLVGTNPPEHEDSSAAIRWLNDRGVHVIYRHVSEENNGCTLADYLTLNSLGGYVNLEVEHGDTETQPIMIDILMEFFASPAYRGVL